MGEWRGDGTNDHITVPHRTSLAALTVFTFVWWTRFTAVPGNTIGILEKTNAADNTDGFFLFTQTSPTASVMLTVRDGGNDSNFPSAANLSLGDSQWHQYAVRWWYAQPLASRVQFFRDGLPFTTNPDVSNFIIGPPNDGPMLLGRSNLFNSHLAGSFDHWMFFSRALANAEVRALYLDALAPRSQLLRWMTTGESTASVPPVTAPTRRRVIVY